MGPGSRVFATHQIPLRWHRHTRMTLVPHQDTARRRLSAQEQPTEHHRALGVHMLLEGLYA